MAKYGTPSWANRTLAPDLNGILFKEQHQRQVQKPQYFLSQTKLVVSDNQPEALVYYYLLDKFYFLSSRTLGWLQRSLSDSEYKCADFATFANFVKQHCVFCILHLCCICKQSHLWSQSWPK